MISLPANNLVVLIDQFTKATVETITYDVLSKHVAVVTDIRELGDEHYNSDVVIFEPALSVIVTPSILSELKTKLDLRVFIVYQNFELVEAFKGLATFIQADYSDISWNFVYAVVNNDLAILEPYQRSVKVLDSFKAVKDKIPVDMREYFDRFRSEYLSLVSSVSGLIDDNARLSELVDAQKAIGTRTISALTELKDLFDESQDKINSFETLLSESYTTTFGGFYPERPRVLYIKRISHVAGIDTLLSILFTVITKQYKMGCKIIKLVDSSNGLDMRYVPNTYACVDDPYNTSELLQNDFLLKTGAYSVMFDTLMLNRSGLDFLIVHDMRGVMSLALDQTLIDLRVNEVSSDYATLGEYTNVLSDVGKNVVFPWNYSEIKKFTGTRIVKLVNHPTVTEILDLLL